MLDAGTEHATIASQLGLTPYVVGILARNRHVQPCGRSHPSATRRAPNSSAWRGCHDDPQDPTDARRRDAYPHGDCPLRRCLAQHGHSRSPRKPPARLEVGPLPAAGRTVLAGAHPLQRLPWADFGGALPGLPNAACGRRQKIRLISAILFGWLLKSWIRHCFPTARHVPRFATATCCYSAASVGSPARRSP